VYKGDCTGNRDKKIMIETYPMKIEDFLLVMALNADAYSDFDKLPDEQKRYLANLNIITGEAKSFFEDGRLVAVGGIRYVGLGEAWMITPPQIRDKRSLSLLRETRKSFVSMRDNNNLWRVFAESKISETFLRHLEFKPNSAGYVWTRQ